MFQIEFKCKRSVRESVLSSQVAVCFKVILHLKFRLLPVISTIYIISNVMHL